MTTRCTGSRSGVPACNTLQAVIKVRDASPMFTTKERTAHPDLLHAEPHEISAVLACGHGARFVTSARQLTAWQRAHAFALPV